MDAQKFIRSWPALWLWMNFLEKELVGAQLDKAYTFRKGRLDLHFTRAAQSFKLSWEKQGNQAILTFSNQVALPKRRVNVLRNIPSGSRVVGVEVHKQDRLLRLKLADKQYLVLGFFPAVMNAYLYQGDSFVESFLKESKPPAFSNGALPNAFRERFESLSDHLNVHSGFQAKVDEWMGPHDQLPDPIPGQSITKPELQAASERIHLEPETMKLSFGSEEGEAKLEIQELVIQVLKQSQKPKQAPRVSVGKIAKTLLKRWKSKVAKLEQELAIAETWPDLEIQLQALQIGQSTGQSIHNGKVELPSELSPTGNALSIDLEPGIPLQQAIELTAKKIRKFKTKLSQHQEIIPQALKNIQSLELLLDQDDAEALQAFLQKHGESLDRSGQQQSERKPYKKYQSPGGFDILVGRSSSDNDTLTFKVANKNDWWFHVRQIRGSHVILRTGNQEPQHSDLLKAAEFAALNSKAKHSGIVVVQYCQRKHLSKPKGSSPGTVLVHQEHSITIDLDRVK